MILAKNVYISEGYKENQNVLVLGVPGSGKTRNVVLPHLMETEKSCVVLDTKGELYNMTRSMLKKRGFNVVLYDFIDPRYSPNQYNPLAYIESEQDILTFTQLLVDREKRLSRDPFWPNASQILANALVGFTVTGFVEKERNLKTVIKLLEMIGNKDEKGMSDLDYYFEAFNEDFPNNFASQQYKLFKSVSPAENTTACIVMSLNSAFANIMTSDMQYFTEKNSFDLKLIGIEKTVVFVKSSDTDRSNDYIINIFFQQLFNKLTKMADNSINGVLPNHVHFILDDFGTNLKIERFDSILAGCRSREISCTVILQSTGQLKDMYNESWTTILGSCRSFVFLGSNDLETCRDISLRLDKPLVKVLYKNIDEIFIFTQGEKPITAKRYDITQHKNYYLLTEYTKQYN